MSFQVHAIKAERFASYLTPGSGGHPRWIEATAKPGFPCRVSLRDADVGEAVLAVQFEHHGVDSPYRASGPVFARKAALESGLALVLPGPNQIPGFLVHRHLSVRAYSADGMMVHALTCGGDELVSAIESALTEACVDALHIHNAAPGCFMCAVRRI